MRISAIIPAFNEEATIGLVLGDIDRDLVKEVIVVDNGSTDKTAENARKMGARVISEPEKGYGNACLAGISHADRPDIYVFLDADYSDYPELIKDIVTPIIEGRAGLVIGSRALGKAEKGALTLPQRFGNWLAAFLLNRLFKTKFTDLGPFRAIRREALARLNMRDKKFGWTVEMQIKAATLGVPSIEVPVPYRKRPMGKSKVSGTVKGVVLAGAYILFHLFSAWIKKLFSRRIA